MWVVRTDAQAFCGFVKKYLKGFILGNKMIMHKSIFVLSIKKNKNSKLKIKLFENNRNLKN